MAKRGGVKKAGGKNPANKGNYAQLKTSAAKANKVTNDNTHASRAKRSSTNQTSGLEEEAPK